MKLSFYLKAVYLSLYSREFYSNLIKNLNVTGLKYLFILALITSIPLSIHAKYILNTTLSDDTGIFERISDEEIDENLNLIENQTPEITFSKNQFSSNYDEPSYIYNKAGRLLAIVDTNRKLTSLENIDNAVILKDSELLMVLNGSSTGALPAAELHQSFLNYFELNDSGISTFSLEKFYYDFVSIIITPYPAIFLFCVLWFFTKFILNTLLYSFLTGLILNLMLKNSNFNFKTCFKITAFTITPVALMELTTYIYGNNIFNYSNLVYFVTHILYIHFAIESFKKV